ncbi:DUF1579 domain-containing protein [Pelomonas sp. SE-A7]|uniref:DUF1579 domain-containing protein n=1 Tax=Pelomonas sp. SE-A7 TaxID=3054953 RepID=UPI00259CB672|nr:DUF1579 domain-containing protein [Pelomonas sp. SE-A7]MDM4766213.1 DUF1579 domain-containing protein [Pelomonas sp. SE-A7]
MKTLIPSLLLAALCLTAQAQPAHDPQAQIRAQREAMLPLAKLDGAWRGSAWTLLRDGSRQDLVQTERVGSFLDGSVKVIEGRGYEADGRIGFNALGVISYDPATKAYTLQSNALGRSGNFPLSVTANGFIWSIPAGAVTIRYTAVIEGDSWVETGEVLISGREPIKNYEMRLKRIGSTDWPGAGAVPMR